MEPDAAPDALTLYPLNSATARAWDATLANALGWVRVGADRKLTLTSSESEATSFFRWRGRHGAGRFAYLHTAGLLLIALVRAFDGKVVISRIHVDRVESLVL